MTQPGGHNAGIIAEFRANHGQVGGGFAGAPLLLLHTTGARTGTPRVSPVMYLADDGQSVEVAYKDRRYVFPKRDVVLLPIANTTAELLGRYIGQRLLEVLRREQYRRRAGVDRRNRRARRD